MPAPSKQEESFAHLRWLGRHEREHQFAGCRVLCLLAHRRRPANADITSRTILATTPESSHEHQGSHRVEACQGGQCPAR